MFHSASGHLRMISYTIVPVGPIIPKYAMFLALLMRPRDDSVRYRTCRDRARRSNMDNMDWDHGVSDGNQRL